MKNVTNGRDLHWSELAEYLLIPSPKLLTVMFCYLHISISELYQED